MYQACELERTHRRLLLLGKGWREHLGEADRLGVGLRGRGVGELLVLGVSFFLLHLGEVQRLLDARQQRGVRREGFPPSIFLLPRRPVRRCLRRPRFPQQPGHPLVPYETWY